MAERNYSGWSHNALVREIHRLREALATPEPPEEPSPEHTLRPATGLAVVDSVVQRDVDGTLDPGARQCVVNLEVVDASGNKVEVGTPSTDQIRVWPEGRPEAAVAPRRARVSVSSIIVVDLPDDDVEAWVVEIRDLVDAGGGHIGTLRAEISAHGEEEPPEQTEGGEAWEEIAARAYTEHFGFPKGETLHPEHDAWPMIRAVVAALRARLTRTPTARRVSRGEFERAVRLGAMILCGHSHGINVPFAQADTSEQDRWTKLSRASVLTTLRRLGIEVEGEEGGHDGP